jgi:hypothetical protein
MPPAKFSRGTAKGRARVNKALKLADVAAARSHNANMSGTTHAHAQAASAHQHAAEAHRAAGSYEQAKVHDALAAEHSAKADRGNVSGKTHPPTRGTTNGFPSKHGNKPFSNTHDQHAATANARNATAQAHAREGSSDKHLAASDHRIAATAHGNAANKYMYGSKEYQSHVASADYHSGKARELDARKAPTNLGAKVTPQVPHGASHSVSQPASEKFQNTGRMKPGMSQAIQQSMVHRAAARAGGIKPGETGDQYRARKLGPPQGTFHATHTAGNRNPTTAAGSHVPGHPDYTRAQGASTHAATQSARAHAKPSLVSHSLAAKAHDQAAAAHEHGSAAHEQHTKLAAEHRLEARKHSLKALAARKIGPGQKHGFHGQFEGVPGGAK